MNALNRSIVSTAKYFPDVCRRFFATSTSHRFKSAYEGPGKTTCEFVNDVETAKAKMVAGYNRDGFRLVDGAYIFGPMIILPNNVYGWDITGDEDINENSLEFFFHLVPRLDLVVIGYSDEKNRSALDKNLMLKAHQRGISIEVLPTTKAVGVYNFLVGIRNVGGAFVPPFMYAPDVDFPVDIDKFSEQRINTLDEPDKFPIKYPPTD